MSGHLRDADVKKCLDLFNCFGHFTLNLFLIWSYHFDVDNVTNDWSQRIFGYEQMLNVRLV